MDKQAEIKPAGIPAQSPLFHAQHADRYSRQDLIREYENAYSCRLIVVIDAIFPTNVTLFEELVYDANATEDLHIILASPGGDGETAIRLVRSAQARCKELTVILPDQAKSAATIFTLGAHNILWGPAGDLGPIDPQFSLNNTLVSARTIIDAVDAATKAVQQAPDTYPIHASLLSDVTAIMVQQARSQLARSEELLTAALASNPDRKPDEITSLVAALKEPLITTVTSHGAVFGPKEVAAIQGLKSTVADTTDAQWQLIWRLWTKYFNLGHPFNRVYEGRRQSHIYGP